MLFKSTFLLGLAALTVADSSSDRMVKIKRAQNGIAADAAMAKRTTPSPAENLARHSGATCMNKRHHSNAAAHADMGKGALAGNNGQVDKRDLPLFQGLLSLLDQVSPGLNTAVFGVKSAADSAVDGLDGILKHNSIKLSENQKRELPLFQGLLSLLSQTYPGLNTAVFGVESAANGAVNGLDNILKRDTATVKAKVDLAAVVANFLGASTTVTDLSGTQLSQLRGLAALLNVNQFNFYLGTALSTTQFGTLQSLLGVTVNRLLSGLLSSALLSPSSGLPIGGLLGGQLAATSLAVSASSKRSQLPTKPPSYTQYPHASHTST